jgi:uncharacterized OsmC-like protein
MNSSGKIKETFERQKKTVELRAGVGKGTAVTKVKVTDGLTCEIEEGPWKMIADMPPKWGGNDKGPNPGFWGRGALGSCITIGYMRWAAMLGIRVDELEVEIHADYDTRGELGVGNVNPGYSKIKYLVNIVSPAPREEIINMMDKADRYSSYIDHFVRPIELEREVKSKSEKEIEL